MNEERFKITIYADGKTLEVLDLISDWNDLEIEETAALLLSHSAARIEELYKALGSAALGADQ